LYITRLDLQIRPVGNDAGHTNAVIDLRTISPGSLSPLTRASLFTNTVFCSALCKTLFSRNRRHISVVPDMEKSCVVCLTVLELHKKQHHLRPRPGWFVFRPRTRVTETQHVAKIAIPTFACKPRDIREDIAILRQVSAFRCRDIQAGRDGCGGMSHAA
jgi:hypothetical protein